MSIPALTVTKQYQDGRALTEAQLDAAYGSIEGWAALVAGTAITNTDNISISGIWTFAAGSLLVSGAGAGDATLQYANSANDRTITFPDPGGNDSVAYLAATQTLSSKTLTSPTINDTSNISFLLPAQPINMSLSLSGGLFKVVGIDGADFSATNKGRVWARTATGTTTLLSFTSSPSFQDDAHAVDSDFVGTGTMSWGTTAAVAWANAMPFLLGACTDGTTPIMVIARGPVLTTGASANIGYQDNAPATPSQNNVFALTGTNITVTHANKPITWLGSFRMTKSNVDDWTVTAFDSGDGIGNFYNLGTREYDMPTGQNGAASGKYFADNGGIAPTYTATNIYKYLIGMDGWLHVSHEFTNAAGGTAGSGVVELILSAPAVADSTGIIYWGSGFSDESGGTQSLTNMFVNGATSQIKHKGNSANINNADQSSAARTIFGSVKFKAFS